MTLRELIRSELSNRGIPKHQLNFNLVNVAEDFSDMNLDRPLNHKAVIRFARDVVKLRLN